MNKRKKKKNVNIRNPQKLYRSLGVRAKSSVCSSVGENILSELANDVTTGIVFTGKELAVRAADLSTSQMGRALPYHLGEVAGSLRKHALVIVVRLVLVVPGGGSSNRRAETYGNVLTVRATRVSKFAALVVEVVLGVASQLAIPLHSRGTVLGTDLIVVVKETRCKRRDGLMGQSHNSTII